MGFRRSFLFNQKRNPLPGALYTCFPLFWKLKGLGVQREEGNSAPITGSELMDCPVPSAPELAWEWAEGVANWLWGEKGLGLSLLYIQTIPIFGLLQSSKLWGSWSLIVWSFLSVRKGISHWRVQFCSFLHCLCRVINYSSICFPSSPDVLVSYICYYLSYSVCPYGFMPFSPPISTVGVWKEIEINESIKFVFN